jgi:hypothetical protein
MFCEAEIGAEDTIESLFSSLFGQVSSLIVS